jgi:hypothetical protein
MCDVLDLNPSTAKKPKKQDKHHWDLKMGIFLYTKWFWNGSIPLNYKTLDLRPGCYFLVPNNFWERNNSMIVKGMLLFLIFLSWVGWKSTPWIIYNGKNQFYSCFLYALVSSSTATDFVFSQHLFALLHCAKWGVHGLLKYGCDGRGCSKVGRIRQNCVSR